MTDLVLFASLFAVFAVLRGPAFGGASEHRIFQPAVRARRDARASHQQLHLRARAACRAGGKRARHARVALHDVRARRDVRRHGSLRILAARRARQRPSRSGFLSAYFTLVGHARDARHDRACSGCSRSWSRSRCAGFRAATCASSRFSASSGTSSTSSGYSSSPSSISLARYDKSFKNREGRRCASRNGASPYTRYVSSRFVCARRPSSIFKRFMKNYFEDYRRSGLATLATSPARTYAGSSSRSHSRSSRIARRAARLPQTLLVAIIVVAALAQFAVQVVCFLHLGQGALRASGSPS